ncbi:MAG TPA: YgjP-like metallopeptidase domain-containing protein [Coriobacteriia bacterium]
MRSSRVPPPRPPHDLPPHTVRVSRRARRVRIMVSPRDGLVVVLPRESDRRRVPELLREHAAWIERAMERTAERRARYATAAEESLPARIELSAVGLAFDVEYWPVAADASARVTERAGALSVSVPVGGDEAARAALRRWLSRAAKVHLVPALERVSVEEGLTFSRATVRAQRSRWGSCSRGGAISLNRSLLFLTPELARCVMVHELVHMLRHDHSPAFWAMLRERVPEVERLRRELRQAWRRVPGWAEPA